MKKHILIAGLVLISGQAFARVMVTERLVLEEDKDVVRYIQKALQDIHDKGGANLSIVYSSVNPEGLFICDTADDRYPFYEAADKLADYLNCLNRDNRKTIKETNQKVLTPRDSYQEAFYEKMRGRLLAMKGALNGSNSAELQRRIIRNGLIVTFLEGNFAASNSDLMDYLMKNFTNDQIEPTEEQKEYMSNHIEFIDTPIDGVTPLMYAAQINNLSLASFLLFGCQANPRLHDRSATSEIQEVVYEAQRLLHSVMPACINELQGDHKRVRKHHIRRKAE